MGKIAFPSVLELAFLPRDAMRKRDLCRRSVFVRLSVCLFIAFVYCIQMADDIVKLLSRPDSPIILVFFDNERRYPVPKGIPSAGAHNTRGGNDFRFSTEIAVCLGNGTRKAHMVIMER